MPLPIPSPRTEGTTSTTPVPLYWARYGDPNRPTLIVLHGGPGADHRYLLPQMLHLAERYDLLLYDQRGSGRSRAENNAPITWRDHVADLSAICHEFGIRQPSLVGYSWGGMLALLYTCLAFSVEPLQPAAAPSHTSAPMPQPARLVLISPAPVNKSYRTDFDDAMRRRGNTPEIVTERQELMNSGARELDPEGYRQRIFELGVAAYFANTANARDLTPFRVVGRVQQSTWESLGDYNLLPALERIRVPVKIVHGREDPIPPASSTEIARALDSEVVFIENCGHVPYVEQPAALWAALDPFLASTDPVISS